MVACFRGLVILVLYQLYGVPMANWANSNFEFCSKDILNDNNQDSKFSEWLSDLGTVGLFILFML